ncbi:glutamine synthetase family protein [Streptomyces xanthochromogenes]|uniref:glutamine synthetase family protein n=1 Tax=Streptomyces xanthochromogenes TaxID=67384 RepID=UPI0034350A6C
MPNSRPPIGQLPRLSAPSARTGSTVGRNRPRQAGRLNLDELRTAVAKGRIDTVLLALPDLQGRLKGKRYGADHFLQRVAGGHADMCAYLLATDAAMNPVDGFGLTSWENGYADLAVAPDLNTLRLMPWLPRTVVVLGHALNPRGQQPLDVAPRQMLLDQLARLAAHGLHAKAGLESEFLLYEGLFTDTPHIGDGGLAPVSTANLDYALDHPPVLDRFLRRLQSALAGAGSPVEAVKTESAPGQVEVTFPYGPALEACDTHVLFKHAARTLAGRAGLTATYMAAPETGVASGLHVHVSLWRSGNPALVTLDGDLSGIARQAIGGLVEVLPQLAPLYAPNTNSYRRFTPGSFAPTRMTWGHDNRTCAVRVVGHDSGLHLEVRVPGADANPYLATAAVLAAITHGLDQKLTAPPPRAANAYLAQDIPLLPATLDEALAVFRNSPLAEKAFGPEVVAHFAHLAQVELAHQHGVVPDTERDRWFIQA